MMTSDKRTTDQQVKDYNDDCLEALNNVLTWSLKKPQITLADMAGLAVNDNEEEGVVKHG